MPVYANEFPDSTPLAILLLISCAILIVLLPRKYAPAPFLAAGLLLPPDLSINVLGLRIGAILVPVAAGWGRIFFRGELYRGELNTLDKAALSGCVVYALSQITPWRNAGASAGQAAYLFSSIGIYLLLRSWIRDPVPRPIGAALFAASVALLAMGHFDQCVLAWYALLAMTSPLLSGKPRVPFSSRFHEHKWFACQGHKPS